MREFARDQVWSLKEFAGSRVVIGTVETRGDRRIVHASVFDLPGPNAASTFFIALDEERDRPIEADKPKHFIVSGMSDEKGGWSLLTSDLSISADYRKSSIAIPHIVVYEDELRAAVSVLSGQESPHFMFKSSEQLWRDGENRWRELNDGDLNRPFRDRIGIVMRSVARTVSDPKLIPRLGPAPPAVAEIAEVVVDDPALAARCQEVVDPGPLDPRFVADLIEHGFTREEIPEIDVTLSNITITQNNRGAHIWRADAVDQRPESQGSISRAVCWRNETDEQPGITFYPMPMAAR
jgi:hypothetical protein